MNPEIKAKWIEALRSGNYQQGIGALRLDCKFCCLGVLCDVVDASRWHGNCYSYDDHERLGMPQHAFLRSIELRVEDAELLMSLNDEKRWSFEKIADYIEENL